MNNEITINIEELLKADDNSITDCETIRQIALISCTKNDIPNDIHLKLIKKVNPLFEFCGLYPYVIDYNIKPDSELDSELSKFIFKQRKKYKHEIKKF